MIRVGIVDDQAVVRAGLRDFLHSHPEFKVVAEGKNGSQAVSMVKRCPMDVLLMDLCMPGRNGLDALAAVRAAAPQVGVLILSGYPEELYALDLLGQGAAGFLHKNCQPDEIVLAIHAVAEGRFYWTPRVGQLVDNALAEGAARARLSGVERWTRRLSVCPLKPVRSLNRAADAATS